MFLPCFLCANQKSYSPHFIASNGILLYFKGFPEGQLGYQQQKSKFEGMKAYVPDFLGQNRIKPSEEIKVNFRGLRFFNKRHLREHKRMLFKKFEDRDPKYADIYEHKYGTRSTGVRHPKFWEHIPEKVPELIVPDLTGFQLKPYVSYHSQVQPQVLHNIQK